MKTKMTSLALAAVLSIGGALGAAPALAEDIVSLPNLSYRTGPFAATGIPLMNGQRDYMTMINERDGGINGVKLGYEECETGYSTEKGVECYEKTKATGIVTQPWSTGITLQVLPKSNVDKIPILAPGYGFSPMADGKVFKWAFNPPASYWDGASMILSHISGGNLDSLKGKKIVLLHLDAPYGKEPIPLIQSLADKHGFTFLPIPVGVKEMQNQSAQWLQIRRENPDFVLMWGWGAMNAGALTEAVKTKFPMEKFIGIWWSGHDGDMKSVGEAGKGYRSLSWSVPVSDAPAMQDIKKYVLDPKKTEIGEGEFDWVFYQRGVLISMFTVEAIRAAQEHVRHQGRQRRAAALGLREPEHRRGQARGDRHDRHDRAVRRPPATTIPAMPAPGCSNGTARSSSRCRTCCRPTRRRSPRWSRPKRRNTPRPTRPGR